MIYYRNVSTLYVSPDGTGNGKTWKKENGAEGPLGSIDRALSIVEMMRGGGMLQPITIKLLAGSYRFDHTVMIRATMSNITFEPFGDGDVLFAGGKKIEGFERAEFNGAPCFAAHIPEVGEGKWTFTDLYVDGLRADFTRYPEEGFLRMKETEVPSTVLFAPSKWFTAEKEDIEKFASFHAFEDAIISFNHYWIDEHTPVESLDPETGRVTMTYCSRFNIRPEQTYIVENVAETFGHPNEWYLDKKAGMLYYVPRDEKQTPETLDVWAPVTHKFFAINGTPGDAVTGVRFKDITFAYTRGDYGSSAGVHGEKTMLCASDAQAVANADGLLSLTHAENVSFDRCTVRNYGVHGFVLTDGCRNVKIRSCNFFDGGAGGVVITGGIYGSPEHARTSDCTVSDCSILRMGRRYLSACGILLMHACRCDLLHNEIGDLYYTGISCGWTWGYAKTVCRDNRIEYNHIYNLGQGKLSDMGGVYLLGSQPGTVVAYNKIHDIKCRDYGGWALYTDEGSAGILLENNICYNTSSNSYHQHYGTSNVVRNNIFADAGDSLLRVSRPEPHLSMIFSTNILYSKGTAMIDDYSHGQAQAGACLEDGSIVSERNLFFCHEGEFTYSNGEKVKTLDDAKAHGMEEDSMIADPLFRDPANGDFTLSENSPAFALGFRMPDLSSVGPRK